MVLKMCKLRMITQYGFIIHTNWSRGEAINYTRCCVFVIIIHNFINSYWRNSLRIS